MAIRLEGRLHEVMSGDETPIFLATLDSEGRPNCVPVISLYPYEDDTIIFGEFMMNKSKRNLLGNERVGVAVCSDALEAWSLKGTFLGFETKGERFDYMNRTAAFRYNAYTGVRAAGLIRVNEISEKRTLAKPRLVIDFLRTRAMAPFMKSTNGHRRCMPPVVEEKFRRMSALRALAFKDADEFPRAFPLFSGFAVNSNRLLISDPLFHPYESDIAQDAEVAVAVLTPEAISYQVKGRYRGKKAGTSVIDLSECYSASPPLLGDRLDPEGLSSLA